MKQACGHLYKTPFVTLAIAATAWVLNAFPGLEIQCQLDQGATGMGQAYRLFTCHLAHWSGSHLFWDVATFVLLGVICERAGRAGFVACLIAAAAVVSLSIESLRSGPWSYRGLSGIDSALAGLLTVMMLRRRDGAGSYVRWCAAAMIVAFLSKAGFELMTGRAVFVDSLGAGFVPEPLAHLAGAATGGIVAVAGSF